jgi:nucleoside phosphorylase
MRRIAIVSAVHQELGALLAAMPDEAPQLRAGRKFWIGHLDGHEVVAVLSGVGKVAAATTATLLAGEFGVERAIFTGTAGGLHPEARVGDVVVADALLQHDMDASPLFPRHEVPFYAPTASPPTRPSRRRSPRPPGPCSKKPVDRGRSTAPVPARATAPMPARASTRRRSPPSASPCHGCTAAWS